MSVVKGPVAAACVCVFAADEIARVDVGAGVDLTLATSAVFETVAALLNRDGVAEYTARTCDFAEAASATGQTV